MATARKSSRPVKHDSTALGRAFKRRLKRGDLLIGGIATEYLRPSLVKLYRHAGFDFIYIEKEHCYLEDQLGDFVLSARDNGMPAISKIAELGRAETGRLLDAGVVGIQLPRSESREQLLTLIDYVKFMPQGTRAAAPCYGNVDYVWPENTTAWLKKANDSTVIVAHIETATGYENAEEIVSTPHLDMVYVGPCDFAISMGHPGDYDHPVVKKAIGRILGLCRKYKVAFGTTASGPAAARKWIGRGCQFFEAADELGLIGEAAGNLVKSYR